MNNPFRTIVEVKPLPFGLDYSTPTLFVGSCFTENIGQMMLQRKFPAMVNPFGVVYNPVSVNLVLNRIAEGKPYTENELLEHNGQWLSLDHHTSYSRVDRHDCLNTINSSLEEATQFWNNTHCLVVTFGTARVYYYNRTELPVANCHKIPAKEFTNKLLSVKEIVSLWTNDLNRIFASKPNLKIIITVSPVRHWKDSPFGNQVSKATLLLAASQLVELFPNRVFYFPAYEIMMDDLRDYRYYADDMLHPSPLAISYIWDKYKRSTIHNTAQDLSLEIEKILQAVNHRPFNTKTKEFKQFLERTLSKINEITKLNPSINFNEEINTLKGYLTK